MTETELKEYCKDKTIEQIANNFGLTRQHVTTILNYHCIKWKRVYTRKMGERDEMIKYLSERFTYESIAEVFSVSKQRIEQIVNKSNI